MGWRVDHMIMMEHLKLAIEAGIEAGKRILEVYDTSFSVDWKEDNTPLTMADRESHRIISGKLSTTSLPILSEEGKAIPYQIRKNWNRFWLIDPLDGTKEFIRRNGEFTVNIALISGQQPVLGIIYVPVKKILYFASKDTGAYKITNVEQPISDPESLFKVSKKLQGSRKSGTFTVVASRSHFSKDTERFVNKLRGDHADLEFVSAGSSIKLCLIAEGSANIYPRLGPTMEWDTAAGQAIVECAGCKVLDYELRKPLKYNKPKLTNPWFIVS
jgi:3'(2'), 5'-bisphosphate nucleotidase